MDIKSILEKIGFLMVKKDLIEDNIQLSNYAQQYLDEYASLVKEINGLVAQVKGRMVETTNNEKAFTLQNNIFPELTEWNHIIYCLEYEYNEAHKRPLPLEQKAQLARLL